MVSPPQPRDKCPFWRRHFRMASSAPRFLTACLLASLARGTQQVLPCPPFPGSENITSFVCNSSSLGEFPTGFPKETKTISVEFTQLSVLGVEALQGLPKLQDLYLSNNRLKTLPSGLFRSLPGLVALDLSRNLLEDLPPEVFSDAWGLAYLSLGENRLAELRPSWFETPEGLRILYLKHNRLKEIPDFCFRKLRVLVSLDLSFNLLRRLSPATFRGLSHLAVLNLRSNPIRCVAPRTFHGNTFLWLLSLRNGSLTHIPTGLFRPLVHLGRLDLSGNEITSLEPPLVKVSSELTLDLSGNPWACDCRMHALLSWAQEDGIDLFSGEGLVCASPKSLKGQAATSLNGSQLCAC